MFSLFLTTDRMTSITIVISAVSVLLLFVILGFVSKKSNTFRTRQLAFAGISLALSFVLSLLKLSPVLYGGAITLASFVPLLLYGYTFGSVSGFLVGLIFGLLNFLSSPYILTPLTFLLDYVLGFASIGLIGFFTKGKSRLKNLLLGTSVVFFVRFICHLVSGFLYFANGSIFVSLPDWAMRNAFLYSLVYQLCYLPFDYLISIIVLTVLEKTNTVGFLQKTMKK